MESAQSYDEFVSRNEGDGKSLSPCAGEVMKIREFVPKWTLLLAALAIAGCTTGVRVDNGDNPNPPVPPIGDLAIKSVFPGSGDVVPLDTDRTKEVRIYLEKGVVPVESTITKESFIVYDLGEIASADVSAEAAASSGTPLELVTVTVTTAPDPDPEDPANPDELYVLVLTSLFNLPSGHTFQGVLKAGVQATVEGETYELDEDYTWNFDTTKLFKYLGDVEEEEFSKTVALPGGSFAVIGRRGDDSPDTIFRIIDPLGKGADSDAYVFTDAEVNLDEIVGMVYRGSDGVVIASGTYSQGIWLAAFELAESGDSYEVVDASIDLFPDDAGESSFTSPGDRPVGMVLDPQGNIWLSGSIRVDPFPYTFKGVLYSFSLTEGVFDQTMKSELGGDYSILSTMVINSDGRLFITFQSQDGLGPYYHGFFCLNSSGAPETGTYAEEFDPSSSVDAYTEMVLSESTGRIYGAGFRYDVPGDRRVALLSSFDYTELMETGSHGSIPLIAEVADDPGAGEQSSMTGIDFDSEGNLVVSGGFTDGADFGMMVEEYDTDLGPVKSQEDFYGGGRSALAYDLAVDEFGNTLAVGFDDNDDPEDTFSAAWKFDAHLNKSFSQP